MTELPKTKRIKKTGGLFYLICPVNRQKQMVFYRSGLWSDIEKPEAYKLNYLYSLFEKWNKSASHLPKEKYKKINDFQYTNIMNNNILDIVPCEDFELYLAEKKLAKT